MPFHNYYKIPEDEALLKPDKVSTSIIDATGRFHNVTKDFFDALREEDTTYHDNFVSELRAMDFKDVFTTIFKGDDPKLIGRWTEKLGHYLQTSAKLVGKVAITQAAALLTTTSTPILTSYLGAGGKFIAAELVGELANQAIALFGDTSGKTWARRYQEGSWCIVDLQRKRHDSKKIQRQEQYMETAIFGDSDQVLRHDLEKEDYSVGFWLEKGDTLDRHMVFVFECKKVMEVKEENLRLMSTDMADKFDNNVQYSLIREIFILKETDMLATRLQSSTPCEPGTEVIYKDNFYNVVVCTGTQVVMEDADGRRLKADMSDIIRGRTGTSTSYNYTKDGPAVTSGFNEKPLSTGDYIWVPADADDHIIYPGSQVSLAVVCYFQGQLVICFKVYNGQERQLAESRVQHCDPRLQDLFGSIKDFQRFRLSAIQSNLNVREKAVGKKYANLCFGDIEGFPRIIYEIAAQPGEVVVGGEVQHEVLPRADNKLLAPSGTRLDELEDKAVEKADTGTLLLSGVAIVAVISVAYFALK
jgi:hypothetical protein